MWYLWYRIFNQWCENSQSYRTLSDKSSECLVNWNWTVYKVYGEQDKSSENRSKCPVVGSMFPHPRFVHKNCILLLYKSRSKAIFVKRWSWKWDWDWKPFGMALSIKWVELLANITPQFLYLENVGNYSSDGQVSGSRQCWNLLYIQTFVASL